MGMFDYLRCKYPLPWPEVQHLEYQTKDTFAQGLDNYEIRADGSLWHQECDYEDRSDPNAEGLEALIGACTRVNERWVRDYTTGEIRFYTSLGKGIERWVEFSTYFVRGELRHLEVIEGLNDAES